MTGFRVSLRTIVVLPHRQQMLGAPFKPSFGLSGIMPLDVPLLQFSRSLFSP
jgi:hypothetical protein